MSAEIVNLRQARKLSARADRSDKAAENRAKHGRSKAEKSHDKAVAALAARRLDQLKRGDEPPK